MPMLNDENQRDLFKAREVGVNIIHRQVRHCVKLIIPDYFQSGTYTVSTIILMEDVALNAQQCLLSLIRVIF